MAEEEKKELNNLKYALEIHHIDNKILFKMENLIQEQQKIIKKMAKQLNKLIYNIDFDKELQEGEDYSECIEEYIREQMKEGV